MLPSQDTTIVSEALAMLIGEYQGPGFPNIQGLIAVAGARAQNLENVAWDVIGSQLLTRTFPPGTSQGELSGPPDQALLQIADLVGAPVGTWTTQQLALLVQLWILADASNGTPEDILSILTAVEGAYGALALSYEEYFPAAFQVWATGFTTGGTATEPLVIPIAAALQIAKPGGVYGVFAWGAWPVVVPPTNPTAPGTFYFGDAVSGGGSGLADVVSGDWPEGLLSGVELGET